MAVGLGVGSSSYVSFGLQSDFRTAMTPTITASHRRSGSVFTSRQTQTPRESTTGVMPKASGLWQRMGLVDVAVEFDVVPHDTAWDPIWTAAWGKKYAPVGTVDTFALHNPYIDSASPPADTTFFEGLTMRETVGAGSVDVLTRVVQDICINQFQLTFEADAPVRMNITGTGQKMAISSATSFSEITGTTLAWPHLISSANGGIYVDTANPAATKLVCRRAVFTLDNNLSFEPQLGAATGEELRTPSRAGWPSSSVAFEMWAEDHTSETDMVTIATAHINNTKENCRIEGWIDATHSIELIMGQGADIGVVDDPKPVYNGPAVVGFTWNLLFFPETQDAAPPTTDDLRMVVQKAT